MIAQLVWYNEMNVTAEIDIVNPKQGFVSVINAGVIQLCLTREVRIIFVLP